MYLDFNEKLFDKSFDVSVQNGQLDDLELKPLKAVIIQKEAKKALEPCHTQKASLAECF